MVDLGVLQLLGLDLEVHPRQVAGCKVDENVPNRFQIVSATLFLLLMGAHARVPCCPDKPCLLGLLDVLAFRILKLPSHLAPNQVVFRKTEIDQVHHRCLVRCPENEIIWFDVPVDESQAV
jgi:hypothetical protein